LASQGISFLAVGALAPAALPITADGVTYTMAQEMAWIDLEHFAVGRWDGTLSIFAFNASPTAGPVISNPKATEVQLDEAVTLAQLRSTIERLPQGWNQMVGARGDRLSGGERQRVALARAILQRPRILILDEATSALDVETENHLLEALKSFVADRTLIVISHRLPAALWLNRILVMHNGRIAEERSCLQFQSINETLSMVLERSAQNLELKEVASPTHRIAGVGDGLRQNGMCAS